MNRAALAIAPVVLAMVPAGAHAQSQTPPGEDAEIAEIRGQIGEATELLAKLKERLDDLEARRAGRGTTAAAAMPTASADPKVVVADAATVKKYPAPVADAGGARGPQPAAIDPCLHRDGQPRSPADATTSGTFDAVSGACGRTVAAVLLTGASGSGNVAIKLSRATDGGEPNYAKGETMARSDVYSLTASAPLAKEGPTQLATLDGFASSSRLTFGFTRFMLPLPTVANLRPSYLALAAKAQEKCRQREAREKAAGKPVSFKYGCADVSGELMGEFLSEAEWELSEKILATQTVRRAISYGLELSVGHDEFKYRDPLTLAEADTSRVPLGAMASLSVFPWARTSLTVALDYQRVFKAAKSRTLCGTAAPGANTECFTGPFAVPTKTEKVIASGEFRKVFDFEKADFIPRLGIAPRVEYDANSQDFAFNVPVYLAPDDKGKLIAGIQAGYTIAETDRTKPGKERDFKIGVFVGSSFSLP